MKNKIRVIICITFSFFKFLFIKIFCFRTFKASSINIISPFTEIEIRKNGFLNIGKLLKMRSGCKLKIRKNARMVIGNNVSLNHGCIFNAHESIEIGNDVQFGPNVLIYDHDHDFRIRNGLRDLRYKTSSVKIGNNVWIGANVIILRGVSIGDNCVIGAGTVLTAGKYEQ